MVFVYPLKSRKYRLIRIEGVARNPVPGWNRGKSLSRTPDNLPEFTPETPRFESQTICKTKERALPMLHPASASRVIPATFVFAVLLVGLSGCGNNLSTPEGIANEMLQTSREFVSTLKSVTDESSAKRMLPKIKSLSARMDQVTEAAKKLDKSPIELFDSLNNEKMGKEMQGLFGEMFGQIVRIGADPKLREILGNEMQPMNLK